MEPYFDRNSDPSLRPEGARAINVMRMIVPWELPS
jgi:hypothetical protein